MNKIFIDTSAVKALRDKKDDFHKRSLLVWEKLCNEDFELFLSNYILDESFTLLRNRCGLETAKLFRNFLLSSDKQINIVRVTVADEAGAWSWFLKDWCKLSFTDCVSFAVMKRLNIKNVFGYDKHFERAGFKFLD
ncbi:PIN domain-containing protein [Patescibacteria group bacterium]|nr:PIN domain-containing protein [Patescibacteria group bacterium]